MYKAIKNLFILLSISVLLINCSDKNNNKPTGDHPESSTPIKKPLEPRTQVKRFSTKEWIRLATAGGPWEQMHISTEGNKIILPSEVSIKQGDSEIICDFVIEANYTIDGEDLKLNNDRIYFDRIFDMRKSIHDQDVNGEDYCYSHSTLENVYAGIGESNNPWWKFNPFKVQRFDKNIVIFGSKNDPVTAYQANIYVADEAIVDITTEFLSWYAGDYKSDSAEDPKAELRINNENKLVTLKMDIGVDYFGDFLGGPCPINFEAKMDSVKATKEQFKSGVHLWFPVEAESGVSPETKKCLRSRFGTFRTSDGFGINVTFGGKGILSIRLINRDQFFKKLN